MKRKAAAEAAAASAACSGKTQRPSVAADVSLNTGALMPTVQLGTYRLKDAACTAACRTALSSSAYRGLDTASIYGNEKAVAACLSSKAACPDPRASLFIQTKLWRSHQGSESAVRKALKASLRQLKLDYVDLWLMHWPGPGRYLSNPPVRKAQPVWQSADRTAIAGNDEKRVPAGWTSSMRLETWRHMISCRYVLFALNCLPST